MREKMTMTAVLAEEIMGDLACLYISANGYSDEEILTSHKDEIESYAKSKFIELVEEFEKIHNTKMEIVIDN
jgi:hypothetical protein